jgi:hypothetical protein
MDAFMEIIEYDQNRKGKMMGNYFIDPYDPGNKKLGLMLIVILKEKGRKGQR